MAKILIYDIDAEFRESLKAALIALGHEPLIANDGYSVGPLAVQNKPGAIILDFKLPEADGYEILKRLRGMPALAMTPIIFASTTPKFEIEFVVLDAPAVGYIDKPLNVAQLKETITSMVGSEAPVAKPAPVAPPPMMDIPPPGAPLSAPQAPTFNGEPDLDGSREDVIDLD